jgi:aspartate 1-decarboxylase
MDRLLLRAKLHHVRVTDVALEYVGSIGIDEALMEAADLAPYEKVLVANIENGARFETYVIAAPRGSGKITLLGAAARLVHAGDRLIVLAFGAVPESEIAGHRPKVVHVDEQNRPIEQ